MIPYMLIDFGSTFTKVTGVDIEAGELLGTAKAFTTIHDGILIGLKEAVSQLEKSTKITQWDKKLACSSAAGGLRMIALGLVPELTAKAAKEAALSAGAKVLKTYSMELTDQDISEIDVLKPDILLLSGGTDGGNKKVVLHNAHLLKETRSKFPVIYAGNRSIKKEVTQLLTEGGFEVIPTENVMPSFSILNILPARKEIQQVFLDKIIVAKGIKEAEKYIDNVLMPTPLAVMKSAKLLADGVGDLKGLGQLLVVDMGGATTDVHSVCPGLPSLPNVVLKGIEEPYVKRSVEGDLGARYSLQSSIDHMGLQEVEEALQWEASKMNALLAALELNPEMVSQDTDDALNKLDQLMAKHVTKESVDRHAGYLKEHYTPFGKSYEQFGKDLTEIKSVIGTGGPLIHSGNPLEILEQCQFIDKEPYKLKPKQCRYYLDQDYILAAMGLLSEYEELTAMKILMDHLELLNQYEEKTDGIGK